MTRTARIFAFAGGLLVACQPADPDPGFEYGSSASIPDSVGKSTSVYGREEDVLSATFEANRDGYQLQSVVTTGVPTSAIHQSRPVLIVATDASGQVIVSLSVLNPRD